MNKQRLLEQLKGINSILETISNETGLYVNSTVNERKDGSVSCGSTIEHNDKFYDCYK